MLEYSLSVRTLSVVWCALLLGGVSHADERCAVIQGGADALAAISPAERLSFIQRRLNADARRVRIWAWSWAAIYSGLVVYNGIRLSESKARDDVIDNGFGTGASMLGLAVLTIMPPAVLRDQPRLARIVERSSTDSQSCALVAAAEHILLRDAASEAFGQGPLVHAGSFVFNMGLGILLGAGFGRWTTGAIVTTSGIAVSELQQATIRTHVGETLSRYRRGQLSGNAVPAAPTISWAIVPLLERRQLGVSAAVTF